MADSTSPFIWLLHPIMKIPPAPIPFLLPGLDNICKLWKARASNNDFDTISQCTGSEKVCKTKCLGVEGVSIGRGKFCTEIYMGRFAGSVWFFVLQGGWRFDTSFPVRPNLMYCSNRNMGLDFLLFWLWGRLKKVKRNAANFINPPPIIPGIERGQIQPEWYLLLAQIGQKLFLKITMFQNFESVFRVVLFKRGRLLNLCPRAWMLSLFPFDTRFNRNLCWLKSSSTFAQYPFFNSH